MQSNKPNAAILATFWFGIQALWGALLGISLQTRSIELRPHEHLLAYGQLAMTGAMVAVVTQLVMGPISDRLRRNGKDRRWFFMVGAAIGSAGIFAFYLAPTFGALVSALILLQVAMNTAIGPYQAIIPDYFSPAVVGRASSWMAALQSLGNAAGAVAAFELPNQAFTLAVVLSALLLISCAVTVVHAARLTPRPLERAVTAYGISRAAIDLFVSRGILWIAFYTMLGYMLFYIHDTLGIENASTPTGLIIIIFTVFGAAGAALTAKPSDTIDRRIVVNASTALFILSLIAFALVREVRFAYAIAAFAGAGWGGFLAADWALGCSILPPNLMATAMGIWNIAVAGPQILAPALTTGLFLLLRPALPAAPLYAFALAIAAAAAGALWIWRLPPSTGPAR